ncbi:MAG TPA: hypothetical protein VGP82_03540 [Ktedonobacterales bacterium]|nr:hypothetical protein [Ktedonobacterales bacterium]
MLDRVRPLDGCQPISLERSRIPLDARTEPLLDIDFARESLIEAMVHRAGLVLGSGEGWVEVARCFSSAATSRATPRERWWSM